MEARGGRGPPEFFYFFLLLLLYYFILLFTHGYEYSSSLLPFVSFCMLGLCLLCQKNPFHF